MYLLAIDTYTTECNAWFCVRDWRVRTATQGTSCELNKEFEEGPVLFQGDFDACYAFAAGFGVPLYKYDVREYTAITKAARERLNNLNVKQ